MNVLLIGGSRFIGPLIIQYLLQKGHKITVFNRGVHQSLYPKDIRFIKGDRDNGIPISEKFDVVIDTSAYTGIQTQKALQDLQFDLFIHLSTVAVYQKSSLLPYTEDSPLGQWPLWGEYNRRKVECEQVLQKSGIPYASVRPVYILGAHNYLKREEFIYAHIKKKKQLSIPGDGKANMQFVFVEDVARSLCLIAEKKSQGVFNCAGDEVVSLEDLMHLMAKIVGSEALIRYNPTTNGVNFIPDEFPFANEDVVCSNLKLKSLGISFTPLFEGLNRDYQNYYQNII